MARRLFSVKSQSKKIAVLLLIAGMIMIVDPMFPSLFSGLKHWVPSTFDPIMNIASHTKSSIDATKLQSQSKADLIAKIQRLETQTAQNQTAMQVSIGLAQENQRLRNLLALDPKTTPNVHIAEVIGIGKRNEQVLILNKGRVDGIFVGQIALDSYGVLGQVTSLFAHSAKLHLLTDESQSISVRNARTGKISVVSGTGKPASLTVDFIPNTADVKIGDMLYSSGIGTIFPANYPVGKVASIAVHGKTEFSDILVTPYAQFASPSQVILLGKHDDIAKHYAQPAPIATAPSTATTTTATTPTTALSNASSVSGSSGSTGTAAPLATSITPLAVQTTSNGTAANSNVVPASSQTALAPRPIAAQPATPRPTAVAPNLSTGVIPPTAAIAR